jgi:hypothetical protein
MKYILVDLKTLIVIKPNAQNQMYYVVNPYLIDYLRQLYNNSLQPFTINICYQLNAINEYNAFRYLVVHDPDCKKYFGKAFSISFEPHEGKPFFNLDIVKDQLDLVKLESNQVMLITSDPKLMKAVENIELTVAPFNQGGEICIEDVSRVQRFLKDKKMDYRIYSDLDHTLIYYPPALTAEKPPQPELYQPAIDFLIAHPKADKRILTARTEPMLWIGNNLKQRGITIDAKTPQEAREKLLKERDQLLKKAIPQPSQQIALPENPKDPEAKHQKEILNPKDEKSATAQQIELIEITLREIDSFDDQSVLDSALPSIRIALQKKGLAFTENQIHYTNIACTRKFKGQCIDELEDEFRKTSPQFLPKMIILLDDNSMERKEFQKLEEHFKQKFDITIFTIEVYLMGSYNKAVLDKGFNFLSPLPSPKEFPFFSLSSSPGAKISLQQENDSKKLNQGIF